MKDWNTTPAPKDREIVAIGKVVEECSDGGIHVNPFCAVIAWSFEQSAWIEVFSGLVLAPYTDSKVSINKWTLSPIADEESEVDA